MYALVAAAPTSSDWQIIIGIVVAWMISVVLVQRSVQLGSMWAGLCGLGASIYLTGQHYSEEATLCSEGTSTFFNCDEVNQHEVYSEIGSLPVSVLGGAFFFAVLFVAWRSGSEPEKHHRFPQFLLLAGIGSVIASGIMATISFGIIGQICPFCVALYGLSLVLLWAGWKATSSPGGSLGARFKGDSSTAETTKDASLSSGAIAFTFALLVLYTTSKPSDAVTPTASAVVSEIELVGDEVSEGAKPDSATYTIIEYADLQCGACAANHEPMKKVVAGADDIALIFKHFPLVSIHPLAVEAAKGALCAQEQGKAADWIDAVFGSQRAVFMDDQGAPRSEEQLARQLQFLAKQQLEMDAEAFTACMNRDATAERLQNDIDSGNENGVNSTPSFFLKGICDDGRFLKMQGGPAAIETAINSHRAGQDMSALCNQSQ